MERKYMKSLIHFWEGWLNNWENECKNDKEFVNHAVSQLSRWVVGGKVKREREMYWRDQQTQALPWWVFRLERTPCPFFQSFLVLSAVFFLYLLKKGHYGCLVGLKPLRNPESKPQPKTVSSIWWIWGETYINFYQMAYSHRIWCNQNVLSMSSQCYLIALVSWANRLWYLGKYV